VRSAASAVAALLDTGRDCELAISAGPRAEYAAKLPERPLNVRPGLRDAAAACASTGANAANALIAATGSTASLAPSLA